MLVLVAMLVGAIVPVQTAINTRFRASVGSPIAATFVTFIIAVVTASGIACLSTSTCTPNLTLALTQPWWVWLGGFMGVQFIVGNIVLFPQLGPIQTVILPILGQVIMGLLVDRFGLFHYPPLAVGPLRLLGAAIVVVGIVLALGAGRAVPLTGSAHGARLWLLRAFGVLMGMGSATQTAVNGQLALALGNTVHASQISLGVGLLFLLALVLALPGERRALATGIAPGPWWMWFGGFLGVFFVLGGAALSPILGTGTTVIGSLTGTIVCGQLLEIFGIGTGTRTRPTPARLLGLALVLAGVAMVRLL